LKFFFEAFCKKIFKKIPLKAIPKHLSVTHVILFTPKGLKQTFGVLSVQNIIQASSSSSNLV
jgi:hypothetical protein